jgi:outer membrane protein OmpA-like peptidoglycan-associated protein
MAAEFFDSLPTPTGSKSEAPTSTPSSSQLKSVAKGTYINSEVARISSNLTATINLPSNQVILSDYVVEDLSTKARITFSEKGLTVTPISGFTGSIFVPSVAMIDGEEVIVLNKIIVNPVAPAAVGFTPVSFKRSAISWTPSSSKVTGYEIAVNGKVVCKTTKSTCPISALIGPNSKVTITALGNEETSSDPVLVPYVARAPIPALKVNFASASATLSEFQNTEIRTVSTLIREQGFTKLEIFGFADSRGSKVLNDKLSQARAIAVADLMRKLLPKVSVNVAALGVSKPIGDNAKPKGQAQNRRTEISTW